LSFQKRLDRGNMGCPESAVLAPHVFMNHPLIIQYPQKVAGLY
jgi:hypothetical protein